MTLSNTRMCVITRKKKNKSELIKITKIKDHWYLDLKQQLFGRSFYLILDETNINKLSKQQKRFKMSNEDFNLIITGLKEQLEKENC